MLLDLAIQISKRIKAFACLHVGVHVFKGKTFVVLVTIQLLL